MKSKLPACFCMSSALREITTSSAQHAEAPRRVAADVARTACSRNRQMTLPYHPRSPRRERKRGLQKGKTRASARTVHRVGSFTKAQRDWPDLLVC